MILKIYALPKDESLGLMKLGVGDGRNRHSRGNVEGSRKCPQPLKNIMPDGLRWRSCNHNRNKVIKKERKKETQCP